MSGPAPWCLTGLAAALVLAALVLPGQPGAVGPAALHLPLEAVLGAALLLVLPARVGMVLATAAGAVLGLLTMLTVLDFGFVNVLSRPFDPTADWHLAGSVVQLLTGSLGRPGAIAALVGFLVLVAALLVAVTLATRRVAAVVVQRRPRPGGPSACSYRSACCPSPSVRRSCRAPRSRLRAPRVRFSSGVAAWSPGRASSARSRPPARRTRCAGWTRTSCWRACAARTWWSPSSRATAATR